MNCGRAAGLCLLSFAWVVNPGCASAPPEGSLSHIKQQQRKELALQCAHEPKRFGFPYSREEFAALSLHLPGRTPNLHTYCWRISRLLVQ